MVEILSTYPANVRIEESPPDSIFPNFLHPATPIQEDGKHPLAQINDGGVFLGFGRLGGIIGHCMLLWNRGDDERGMEVNQCLSQGSELGVSSPDFQILGFVSISVLCALTGTYSSPYRIYNETTAALMVLPGVGDEDRHVRVLVENLFYTAIVMTLSGITVTRLLGAIAFRFILIAQILRSGNVIGRILVGQSARG
jgi:hypothetical protein